jgi:hypothetical protein
MAAAGARENGAVAATRCGAIPGRASLGRYADALLAQAIRGASSLLEQARPLLEKATPFVKLVTDALEGTERTVSGIGDRPNFDTAAPPHLFDVSMPEPARMTADAVPLAGDAVGRRDFLSGSLGIAAC